MENNPAKYIEEVVFGSSDKKISRQVSKLLQKGLIRKIASRVYTSNLKDPAEEIIRRNLFIILGNLYPDAIISHRSAFEFNPTAAGHIFLTYKYTKNIKLPGITIRLIEGPGPIEGDNSFFCNLYASQQARAYLENLQQSKRPGATSKTLTRNEIEEKLDKIVRINGEVELNKVRDRAREIAVELGMEKAFAILNLIVSSILNTHKGYVLSSTLAASRALGFPYDPNRLQLFAELFRSLQSEEFAIRPENNTSEKSFKNFAFFESYFSNYIEGTVFEIDEAKQIIETNLAIPARNADSHDILGTYLLVSSRVEMSKTPGTADELLSILQHRHRIMLSARTDKKPGLFKDRNNFAGQTEFVDYNLVKGTIVKSFDFYKALNQPFAKAAYIMFVISEVHPFIDGNGRLARVMMNSELVAGGQSKIIIPTVYRDDYLGVLRKLTRKNEAAPYIRMLNRAFAFSANVYGESIDKMQQYLEECNAFLEHTEGKLKIF